MMNIMSFLEEPADVARLCYLSAGWICHSTAPYCPKQWETWYGLRTVFLGHHKSYHEKWDIPFFKVCVDVKPYL